MADLMLAGNEQGLETLDKKGSADISYGVPGLCRFRVNIFRQRGSVAIVMRVIPTKPPNWQELNLPDAVKSVANLKNGLVLVTGPTGSGKSTTLAAIIDLINSTKKYHVVTIEDPIEFIHEHKLSTIHQRELHSDTPDFALALRAALRQAPKVILSRRDARPRDHRSRNGSRRDRPPCAVNTAYKRRRKNYRPHHRRLPKKRRADCSHLALRLRAEFRA